MATKPDLTDLTDLHLLILGALWARGKATIRQIHESIGERGDVTSKTIGILLNRLEKRGIVSREAAGREGLYSATVTRPAVLVARVGGALASVFAGEDEAIGTAAVRRRHTRPDDRAELLELLRRAEKEVKSK